MHVELSGAVQCLQASTTLGDNTALVTAVTIVTNVSCCAFTSSVTVSSSDGGVTSAVTASC